MSKNFGWWVDLAHVALADAAGHKTSWVHALPFGTYQHPLHGDLVFDTSKLSALAASVKAKVRGIDPDVDYDHKEDPAKGNQAAGWVKDAEVRADGLYLQVEWTDGGAADITSKRYRYFSAEFTDTWTDNLGKTHTDVLLGGGLTNRPFMKNLLPVNLSELNLNRPEGGQKVDPKKLRESLGLAEGASDEDVLTKLGELGKTVIELTAKNTELTTAKTTLEAEVAKLKEKDPEVDPALKALIDSSPAFAKMFAENQEKDKKLAELQVAMKLSDAERQLAELQTGKRFAITPVYRTKLRDLMVKLPADGSKELTEFVKAIIGGTGLVDLSERGYTSQRGDDAGSATNRFNEAVKKLMEENKDVDYGTAVERIAREDPALFNEYREDTYIIKA